MVTGLGLVTSLGTDPDPVLDAILSGQTGHRSMARFAGEDLRHDHAAPVAREAVLSQLAAGEQGLTWPAALAVVAGRAALRDAGHGPGLGETPMFVGTSLGAASALDLPGVPVAEVDLRDPTWFSRYPLCAVVSEAAAALGARGEVHATTATCAAGNYALGLGLGAIRSGRADRALCGGADEVSLIPYLVFHQIRAVGSRCRPFDVARDGLLFGEGAAFVVLEREAEARARGARIYASFDGVGYSNDAHHLVAPDPQGRGAELAIRRCLDAASLTPADIGYVNAHGTGTVHNDATEATAIVRALGRDDVPISSTKGATGHCMGAASAVEAVITIAALARGTLPPTVGLETPDPEIPGRILSAPTPCATASSALSVGLGFGGNNAVAAFSHPPRRHGPEASRPVYIGGGAALTGSTQGLVATLSRLQSGLPAATDEVTTFVAADILGRRGLRHVDRAAVLFAAAIALDLRDWPTGAPQRAGAVLGSALPSYGTILAMLEEYQASGPRNINPMRVQFAAPNAASSWWMIRAGITGFSGSVTTGDCSGIDAIRVAAEQVAAGHIDRAVAGGVHAAVAEAWEALPPGRPLVEAVSAVTVTADPAGAWARVVAGAARFEAGEPGAAVRRAVAAVLESAGLLGTPIQIWTDHPLDDVPDNARVTVLTERLGRMRGAGSSLAVAAAADAIHTGGIAHALACSQSPEGFTTALLLARPGAVNGTSE